MDGIIDPKTVISTAKLVSFPSAFFVAGYCYSFSHNTFPAIREQRPQFSATSFKQIWTNANPIVPGLTLLSTSAAAYLAYAVPEQRREWTKAAIAMAVSVPWTALVMGPSTKRLIEIASDEKKTSKSEQNLEHRQLLIRWVKQNYVAVALQLASAVFGVQAIIMA